MNKLKKVSILCMILMFFVSTHSVWAQQREYLNPERNPDGVVIRHRVNLSRYSVRWRVVREHGGIIVLPPGNPLAATPVRERFATSQAFLNSLTTNAEVIIRWDGRYENGQLAGEGHYYIEVFNTPERGSAIKYRFPVTITTQGHMGHGFAAGGNLDIMLLEALHREDDLRRELEIKRLEIADLRRDRERERRDFAAGWINLANRTIDFSYRLMGETREREIVNMIETLE